jgi:YD repeat-containing protein
MAAAAALLTSSTALATVLYTYDDLGRVTSITYDDGKRVTYSYDPAGNRTQHVVDEVANQAPVAVNDAVYLDLFASPFGNAYTLVNDTDPNNDLLIVQSVTTPSKGSAIIGGGGSYVSYTYTGPYNLAPTTDSFDYTISDGRGGTATATVNITIENNLPCIPPPGEINCEIE